MAQCEQELSNLLPKTLHYFITKPTEPKSACAVPVWLMESESCLSVSIVHLMTFFFILS